MKGYYMRRPFFDRTASFMAMRRVGETTFGQSSVKLYHTTTQDVLKLYYRYTFDFTHAEITMKGQQSSSPSQSKTWILR